MATTTEKTLATITIPAGTLAARRKSIRIVAYGTCVASNNYPPDTTAAHRYFRIDADEPHEADPYDRPEEDDDERD